MTHQQLITFLSEDVSFELESQESTQTWIQDTILSEKKTLGEITYIFCSDVYIHKLNLEHLKHDTYTDIITFDYSVEDVMAADVFISVDRVKENATIFKTSFQEELNRVIIHGVLHLVGYNDKTNSEKELMRSKEDFYLTLLTI